MTLFPWCVPAGVLLQPSHVWKTPRMPPRIMLNGYDLCHLVSQRLITSTHLDALCIGEGFFSVRRTRQLFRTTGSLMSETRLLT